MLPILDHKILNRTFKISFDYNCSFKNNNVYICSNFYSGIMRILRIHRILEFNEYEKDRIFLSRLNYLEVPEDKLVYSKTELREYKQSPILC